MGPVLQSHSGWATDGIGNEAGVKEKGLDLTLAPLSSPLFRFFQPGWTLSLNSPTMCAFDLRTVPSSIWTSLVMNSWEDGDVAISRAFSYDPFIFFLLDIQLFPHAFPSPIPSPHPHSFTNPISPPPSLQPIPSSSYRGLAVQGDYGIVAVFTHVNVLHPVIFRV